MNKENIIKNEIGSEFWEVPICKERNKLFLDNTKWFISGTSALEFILSDIEKYKKIKTVAVPSWCCSCMITPFLKNGIEVKFYPVYLDEDRKLVCDYSAVEKCNAYLAISYFGYTSQRVIGEMNGIIIRDVTHSIFSKNYDDADYYFGSLRKWAGFWTGGYAWSKKKWNKNNLVQALDNKYLELRKIAMKNKKKYLTGEQHTKEYLKLFDEAEEYLDQCDIVEGCSRDINIAKIMDISFIRENRRRNAKVILEKLKDIAVFPELNDDDCPLFVPIVLPNGKRDALRKYLIERKIYCPIHWSITNLHSLDSKTEVLYNEELSIVCDQRYTTNDMKRIIQVIEEFEANV
ncbi:hypothetical protein H8J65_10250 [Clostridium perfringens]|uniref:hypothetical protein n=1 Tax=Clostridium perfringens TaxID=1502 RepID=UPI0018E48BAF|nr:hypothetical protein [Clostridium perfringens]ELC8370430.1 hypothetical protein [Clostridium perfringens]ELC8374279.1 hypothetical protein [Clostridium perfringens]ELC8374585.1 hypothetical protein [Clostridium perfringens]MBI5983595.1 hypothetical protein [Clostridium perfringens]